MILIVARLCRDSGLVRSGKPVMAHPVWLRVLAKTQQGATHVSCSP